MDEKSCLIYSGQKFVIEWYYDKEGKSVGFDYFMGIEKEQRRKFLVLVKRMGDFGKINEKDLAIKYRQDYFERKTGEKK